MKPERNRSREIGFYVLILVILAATIFSMLGGKKQQETVYSDMVDLFAQEKVQSFVTRGDEIELHVRTGEKDAEGKDMTESRTVELYSFSVFYEDFREQIAEQHARGVIESYDYREGFVVPWWVGLLPYVILIALAMWFWSSMMKQAGGGAGGFTKFSKARTRLGSDEKNKKTFADVAGCDEEKEELAEIVDFLKDPKAYTAMGARIPKGVLLVGPPGTGKTLLAKAVAGEANVQFLSISGSDFVELYVGVGAGRVRDLFEQAKKVAPAIIFIDEIDAVGRQRGSGLGGGNDEREQTLNQLLVELDGFSNNEGVIVMAATNRADILDQALLRPGRFDRQVYVGMPDIRGREAILKIHARGKQLAEDVDLNSIAKGTPGFAGADLENLMNEAALLAVRRRHRFITMEDIDEAILKVQMGPEKKSRKMSSRAQRLTAYHEAGHAVTGRFLEHVDPVHYITIIPRGPAGGFTLFRPQEDLENFKSRSEMFESIVMALGGRMAEKLFLDDISTGASGDIQQATAIARNMVTGQLRAQHLHRPRLRHDQELFRGDRRADRRGGQAHLRRGRRKVRGDPHGPPRPARRDRRVPARARVDGGRGVQLLLRARRVHARERKGCEEGRRGQHDRAPRAQDLDDRRPRRRKRRKEERRRTDASGRGKGRRAPQRRKRGLSPGSEPAIQSPPDPKRIRGTFYGLSMRVDEKQSIFPQKNAVFIDLLTVPLTNGLL